MKGICIHTFGGVLLTGLEACADVRVESIKCTYKLADSEQMTALDCSIIGIFDVTT